MKIDPIMREAYAAKEALAAKYHYDLHALAEAFRKSPTWKTIKKPARPIQTAQSRLKRLTAEDEMMRKLREIKEKIAAENDYDVHKIAEAARAYARKYPLPPPGKKRKMLEGPLLPKKTGSNAPAFRGSSSKSTAKQRGNGKH